MDKNAAKFTSILTYLARALKRTFKHQCKRNVKILHTFKEKLHLKMQLKILKDL